MTSHWKTRFAMTSSLLMGLLLFCIAQTTPVFAEAPPSAELSLSLKPVQQADIDTPDKSDFSKCKVKIENNKQGSGWVVYGPQGQVLRRFIDSNRDGVVDMWRYYKNGLEVYRDRDTNFNKKVDQSRWVNTGGTRWGIDRDEDGTIDLWKRISAEEASREAVLAVVRKNKKRLVAVMISKEEIKTLGVSEEIEKGLLASVSQVDAHMKAASSSLNPKTNWVRFDSSMLMPNLIPKEKGKTDKDLSVYENVMAITQIGDDANSIGFMRIGEMIQVGNVWKLTQTPQPIKGNTMEAANAGLLMQPDVAHFSTQPNPQQMDPKVREALDQLRKLDNSAPQPGSKMSAMVAYQQKRVQLLNHLVGLAKTQDERKQWLQQMIDGISAAVQSGTYPPGLEQLKSIENQLIKANSNSDMVAYTSYRRMLAEYSSQLQATSKTDEEKQKVQEWWLKNLEGFVKKYPRTNDSGDARLQLAMATEFNGNNKEAMKWYRDLAQSGLEIPQVERAKGALKRLELTGKRLALSGKQFGGNGTLNVANYSRGPVLVIYWSTWCELCTQDLPQIKSLYEKYHAQGFEVIGVNVDSQEKVIQPFINKHKIPWKHIYEPGGLESRPAKEFGVILLPTMFLVEPGGKVMSRATSVDELKRELPKMLK